MKKEDGMAVPDGILKDIIKLQRQDADFIIQFIIKKDGDVILNLPKGMNSNFDFDKEKTKLIRVLMQFRNGIKKDYPKDHFIDLFPACSPPRIIEYAELQEIPRDIVSYSIEFCITKADIGLGLPHGAISRLLVKDINDFIHEIPKIPEKLKKMV